MRVTTIRKQLLNVGTVLLILASIAIPAFLPSLSQAATPSPGQGLEISPPLIQLKADPGQTLKTSVKLRNVTKNVLITSASKEDFVAGGEEGNPKILLEPGETSPFSLKDWILQVQDERIVPQQQVKFDVTINVPKDASPGGHYGVLRFTASPEGVDGTGVALSASIGALILVRVSGDIKESAKIADFYVTKFEDTNKGSFFEYGPLSFVERVENTGNVHFEPVGEIVVKNIFGRQVGDPIKVNNPPKIVLPASTRKFEDQKLDRKWMFGRYSATVTLLYGENNKTLNQTIHFWVIPYKLLLLVLIVIIIIVFLTRAWLKRYKKKIINKASNKG